MQKSYNVYFNLGYWFLLLIPLLFAGFYVSYFSVFFQPKASIIHIHFTFMSLWVALLIVQPFLIKYKKLAIHRLLGKLSFVLVPLVLLSAFLMIRYSYYNYLAQQSAQVGQDQIGLSRTQLLTKASVYEALAFLYLGWFILLYSLAIYNRRKTPVHARYMLATALTMLGPTVDRIWFFLLNSDKFPGHIPIETGAFLIADVLLILLLVKDYKAKRPPKALWTCLLIFVIGQVLYFTVPGTEMWQRFVTLVMKPAP